MPLPKGSSRESCISQSYKEMIRAGHPKKQATAAALNHCNKIWGGISKKKDSKKEELIFLEADIEMEMEEIGKKQNCNCPIKIAREIIKDIDKQLEDLKSMKIELAKKKKWMQGAVKKKNVGKTTAECKKMGYGGVTTKCLKALLKRGGTWAKRANFALNARKIAKENKK
jgi:hypothetical protein